VDLEKITREMVAFHERVALLRRQAGDSSVTSEDIAAQALAELDTATEELRMTQEELYERSTQQDMLLESLEASGQRYQQLFEFAPLAYLVTDVRGVIREANRAAGQLLHSTPAFLVGKPLITLVDQEYQEGFRRLLRRLRQADEPAIWEACLRPLHGEPIEVLVAANTARERRGGTREMRWLLHDWHTYRQLAAQVQALTTDLAAARGRATTARMAAALLADSSRALDATPDEHAALGAVARLTVPTLGSLCVVDVVEQQGLRRIAVACADSSDAELARELQERYTPPPGTPHPVLKALYTGRPDIVADVSNALLVAITRDCRHLQLLRALRVASSMVVPLRAHGQTLGTLWFLATQAEHYGSNDLALAEMLAERCASTLVTTRRARELEMALQAQRQFLAVAAHELRSPLAGVVAAADFLQRHIGEQNALTERQRHALHVLTDQATHLRHLADTLLDVSRVGGEQLAIVRRPVNLGTLVQQLVVEIQPIVTHHTLIVSSPGEPVIVEGDYERLAQVLRNLIQNAIVYSPAGGSIAVKLEQQGAMATLAVTDRGIGISAAAQAKLFEPFYRAGNAAQLYAEGLGIGLYVVYEIARRHGGSVEVESAEGQGSTFTIRLPLQPALHARFAGAATDGGGHDNRSSDAENTESAAAK
jgi:PAS domain S-box-containing protein